MLESEQMAEKAYEGPISMTKKGIGFFALLPGNRNRDKNEDLLIPADETLHALHGDLVQVVPTGLYRDPSGRMPPREAGKVVKILSRARETFVGTLIEEDGLTFLDPDYKKMHVPLVILDRGDAKLGDKVLARLGEWAPDKAYPLGTIEEIIGKAGEHDVEMRALALGQGFSPEFPPGVRAEAERLEREGKGMIAEEIAKIAGGSARRDFRAAPTCTIDPVDAKDFDDALSLRALPNGDYEVGVHIADVSFFVRPGDAFDKEAYDRATSVYLVDRTIPMLPEVLSNGLCSLVEGEDRLAVSAVFTLDADARVKDAWFGETVIHSNRRYTYEDAQKTLDEGAGDLSEELIALLGLSKKIRARRQAKGAVDFDTPEVKVELDASGAPVAIHLKERRETNLMIEDFMLLANEQVAAHLAELTKNGGAHFQSLYRVHDEPDTERLENLEHLLRVMGYHLKVSGDGKVSGAELNRLLDAVKGKPEEYLVKTATLRSMAKAVYATKNIGHFGLAFDYYTHFTSPIRRYPDLLVHRLIKSHAGGAPVSKAEMTAFDSIAVHCSEREVAAADAERASVKMKQVEFLSPHVGETFAAVVSGVSDRGLFVEEQSTHADGFISVRDLGDDFYEHDEKHFALVGRRTGKWFQLGNPIRVKLIAARPAEKELDFAPA